MSSLRRTTVEVSTINDRTLPQPPTDTVSCLKFSPTANVLAVGSWDNSVRLYEVSNQGDCQPRAMYQHDQMVLALDWWFDGTKVVSGGGDFAVKMYDLQSQQTTQIGQHDALVTGVQVVDVGQQVVASCSFDKTLKYWDLRSNQPVCVVPLPDKATHLVSSGKLLAVVLMNKQTLVFNLDNPQQVFKTVETTLKSCTESAVAMPLGLGITQATAEGRCDVHHLNPPTPGSNFTFKCHRKVSTVGKPVDEIYNVSNLNYHPVFHTLLTGGADGMISIWDTQQKSRVSTLKADKSLAVTATAFNAQGTLLAYAVGYDWSKGFQYNTGEVVVKVHVMSEWEAKPKQK